MHKLTPTVPRDSISSSQHAQAVCETGSTKTGYVRQPIGAPCNVDCASWLSPPHLFDGHGTCTSASKWLPERAHPRTPYQHKHIDAVWELSSPWAASPQCGPEWAPGALRHAFGLRSRPGTAGFHARRREDFAWSHFFPRSVGFGPTDSSANEAFTMAPSMLCKHNGSEHFPRIHGLSPSPSAS